jgi:hypothetical protein
MGKLGGVMHHPTLDLQAMRREVADRNADPAALKEAQRVYYCLANMKSGPIVFDKVTRLWRGRRHGI